MTRTSLLRLQLSRERVSLDRCPGYSLVELLIIVAIVLTLAAIAVPMYTKAVDAANIARATGDIRTLEKEILLYSVSNRRLPTTLADLERGEISDPWGNPYRYLNIAEKKGKGELRKDRFLVPLNSDFDLYSMGKDGESRPPLTARASRDDIVRASNGSYVGLASEF